MQHPEDRDNCGVNNVRPGKKSGKATTSDFHDSPYNVPGDVRIHRRHNHNIEQRKRNQIDFHIEKVAIWCEVCNLQQRKKNVPGVRRRFLELFSAIKNVSHDCQRCSLLREVLRQLSRQHVKQRLAANVFVAISHLSMLLPVLLIPEPQRIRPLFL
ncbi:MAG: hypothetical protein RL007_1870 [Bacteroidota bacterium]